MSHYVLAALVPARIKNDEIQSYLTQALEPFSENKIMPAYKTSCDCVGQVARTEAREYVKQKFGEWDDIRERYHNSNLPDGRNVKEVRTQSVEVLYNPKKYTKDEQKQSSIDDELLNKWWNEFTKDINEAEEEFFNNHPDKDKPDPTCGFYSGERRDWWPEDAKEGDRYEDDDGCAGTGIVESTSNPNGHWDWWVIGGRWNGWLAPEDQKPENNPDNYEKCYICHGTGMRNDELGRKCREDNPEYTCNGCSGEGRTLKWSSHQIESRYNIASPRYVESLEEFPVPYAYLSLYGEWNSRAKMGWFGISHGEVDMEQWREQWKDVVSKMHDDDRIVVVDMHT